MHAPHAPAGAAADATTAILSLTTTTTTALRRAAAPRRATPYTATDLAISLTTNLPTSVASGSIKVRFARTTRRPLEFTVQSHGPGFELYLVYL